MTPQLMQAIKLLQLSNLDLVAYVEGELERNPLLDQSAEDPEPVAEANGTPMEGGAPGWRVGRQRKRGGPRRSRAPRGRERRQFVFRRS